MARPLFVLSFLLILAAHLVACGGETRTTRPEADDTSADAPAAEPAPSGPPFGGTIMGLRIGVEPTKKEFSSGEALTFTVRAENCLNKALKVPRFADGAWCYRMTFQTLGSGSDYRASALAGADSSEANDVVLQPGEVWAKSVNLSADARLGEAKPNGATVRSLPPGRYEILLGYTNNRGKEAGYWVGGHCWSNPVTIVVK